MNATCDVHCPKHINGTHLRRDLFVPHSELIFWILQVLFKSCKLPWLLGYVFVYRSSEAGRKCFVLLSTFQSSGSKTWTLCSNLGYYHDGETEFLVRICQIIGKLGWFSSISCFHVGKNSVSVPRRTKVATWVSNTISIDSSALRASTKSVQSRASERYS